MLRIRTVFAFLAGVAASIALAQTFHDAPASAKATKNPTTVGEGSKAGAALFDKNCSGCHGNKGEGGIDGPALNSDAAKKATDGELFWFITHGNPANGMPPWESLPETQRWDLVDFVRALQSGNAPQAAASTSSEQPAPASASPNAPFTDYRYESPGTVRKITVEDLPKPYATQSSNNGARLVKRPDGAMPKTLPGFKVEFYAEGLQNPRLIRTAPNGDYFVALTHADKIQVFRGIGSDGKPQQTEMFADGLNKPFGIAFYPPGPDPKYIYIGNTDEVVRIAYKNGDLKASGKPEHILDLPHGRGHSTRDIQFSPDGKRMFVSVGSASNVDDPDTNPEEKHRADILVATPDGQDMKVFASGIRNAVGLAIQPKTGELWCSVNERDGLGDNLAPDYITHVQENGFYGWPWWYIGPHQDPRHEGKHRELRSKVIVPDVLLQPHNASLQMTFYEGKQFPADYSGDIFAAEHGSWNKSTRAGYEVIRIPLHQSGKASGEYEDFLTGFVTENGDVWGRPVGVTVATDGSLLVTDDASGSIWRVSYAGGVSH